MKIYKRGKTTYVDGEKDLVLNTKDYGMNVDPKFMKHHVIRNFHVIGIGSNLLKKIKTILYIIKWIFQHKQDN